MAKALDKREELRRERHRQIAKAALAVFSEKGFNGANVSDVAARAEVSQGTIYLYFKSKEDLLIQALRSFFDDFGQGIVEAVAECPTAAEKLRALGQAMADLAVEAEGLFPLFLEYWASSPRHGEAGELWTAMLIEYKDLIVGIIEEGVGKGEFKPVEAEPLVWAMMAAYDGLAAYVLLMPNLDLAPISRAFMETLVKGLQAESQGGASAS